MLEQKKADVQTTQSSSSARGSLEEEDGDIVPDDSVVSGDITDPEFLQIMVCGMDKFLKHKTCAFQGKRLDAYKPVPGQNRKENKVVLRLNADTGESSTDVGIGKTKTFIELNSGPGGETNTEEDLDDQTIALYDPKWERSTVQLAHNPYSKESIVQRKFSKMHFQLPHPSQTDLAETDLNQGGPKRLNVGPKDINKNFNYNSIKKDFVINREGDDKEEYEDFAFRWTDGQKTKISSSSSMESSEEEEDGEDEAFECMQVDITFNIGHDNDRNSEDLHDYFCDAFLSLSFSFSLRWETAVWKASRRQTQTKKALEANSQLPIQLRREIFLLWRRLKL